MAQRISGGENEPLRVQVITDTHYYSRKVGTAGKAYQKAESKSQIVIKDSDLVIKAGFDMLCADDSTDIVLLSGDTTHNGELDSHAEFIEIYILLARAEKARQARLCYNRHPRFSRRRRYGRLCGR